MTRKTMKAPTPARVNASEMLSSAERSSVYLTLSPALQGASLAATRLSRRFGLPPSTALAVAEANRWGC